MAKILIVDDEPYIRRFLSTLLSHKGYNVTLAEDGQKGLDSFLQERPHVIVLDLQMPGMDGLTVLKQVRNLNPLQPVIILTCGTTEETEQQVRALGSQGVRRKRICRSSVGCSIEARPCSDLILNA